jgi:hypothetical protein
MAIKKLSAVSQETQLYVIRSNLGLRGSKSINLILLLQFVHGISVARKCAHVGVSRGGVCSMAASRHQRIRNATNAVESARFPSDRIVLLFAAVREFGCGKTLTCRLGCAMSALTGKAENMCSH